MGLNLYEYDYELPKDLIAKTPVRPRDSSRLLVLADEKNRAQKTDLNSACIKHRRVSEIVDYFSRGDVLVLNETKVLRNKIYGEKQSGAKASIVVEERLSRKDPLYICRVEARNPIIGTRLFFPFNLRAEIIERSEDRFVLSFSRDPEKYLCVHGSLPTPAYIRKKIEKDSLYQTAFAKNPGSLAAPTSGLHFTNRILQKLKNKGVKIVKITLHVSFGTFTPVKNPDSHKMDKEYFSISKSVAEAINNRKGRLFVCGTTVFKALESSSKSGKIIPFSGYSDIFIKPGHKFQILPDFLITNFHLPMSTLILFVCAFAGKKRLFDAYREAIKKKYRFYSFGDAMLIKNPR